MTGIKPNQLQALTKGEDSIQKLSLYSSDDENSSPRDVDVNKLPRFGYDLNDCVDTLYYRHDSVESEVPLRVVTYNIHGWRDTDHVDNLERIISLLSEVNADVVVLQVLARPIV